MYELIVIKTKIILSFFYHESANGAEQILLIWKINLHNYNYS